MQRTKLVPACALLALLVILGLALSSAMLTAPVNAYGPECGQCGGAWRTVTGTGSGSSWAEAEDEAYDDAVLKAHQGGPSCSPCQLTNGALGYFQSYSTSGATSYTVSWTLHYRCQVCNPGGPAGP